MRTHVSAQEIWDKVPCDGFTLAVLKNAMGTAPILLEDYVSNNHASEYQDINRSEDHFRDKVWVLVGLMNRRERLKFGLYIVDRIEKLNPDTVVRATIKVLTRFLRGNATKAEVKEHHRRIQNLWLQHKGQDTTPRFKMLNATRQLMNAKRSWLSIMRICRYVENHHPNATYEKFSLLAVKILKEEI